MYSKNIIFQHGHIYDAETEKRILVKEGISYILVLQNVDNAEESQFQEIKGNTNKQIVENIEKIENLTHYRQIASKGSYLYFSLSEKDENKTNIEKQRVDDKKQIKKSRFRIKLLEDLFLYSCKHWSKKLARDGKLFGCACVVDESENDKLVFFEKIYAKSIASVYKKTHVHYFGNEGSPSQNTFDSIYFSDNKAKPNYFHSLLENIRQFTDSDKYLPKIKSTRKQKKK